MWRWTTDSRYLLARAFRLSKAITGHHRTATLAGDQQIRDTSYADSDTSHQALQGLAALAMIICYLLIDHCSRRAPCTVSSRIRRLLFSTLRII